MAIIRQNLKSISRRDFLKGAVACAAAGPFAGSAAAKKRKPNLLFILTDQQRADTMAVYGNHKIHAPNFNKLAKESIVFRNAYVSQPVCTPSRCTILTGRWPHTTGLTENNIALPKNFATFPEILDDPDYRTAYMGKWHLGDEVFAQRGFEQWESIEDIYSDYFGEDRDPVARSTYHHFLCSLGYEPDKSDDKFSREFASRLPIHRCKPKFLEMKACDFLRRHRNEHFILYVSFLEPHPPFFGPLNDEHSPEEIELPINFRDPLEDNEPDEYRRRYERYLRKGIKGDPLKTEADWRWLIAKYWGLVTQVDRSSGAILGTLERLDLADNTIVVFTSDHGDMMGSHGLVTKSVMYQEAVRVAWLMRLPALGREQKIVEHPVSHIDLVPTLLEVMQAGKRSKELGLPGKSLIPLVQGEPSAENHVYIEWNAGGSLFKAGRNPWGQVRLPEGPQGTGSRAVVTPDGWKLSLNDRDKNQLFNLQKDPGETKNLFGLPEYQGVIRKLARKIHAWQEQVNDTVRVTL